MGADSINEEDIVAILKGDRSLDHPVAVILAKVDLSLLNKIGQMAGIEFNTIHNTYCAAIELESAATPEKLADYPEVVHRKAGPIWSPDKPLPLTPFAA